jgi:hypothetical protein
MKENIMPTFEVASTSGPIGTAAAYTSMTTTANRRAAIREIGVFAGTAVACFVGEGIPANTPTVTTSVVPQPKDANDAASTATVVTAWGTAPTAPSVFRRQTVLGAAVGAGTIWKFALDERTWMSKSTWECLWNFGASTSAPLTYYYEYDE